MIEPFSLTTTDTCPSSLATDVTGYVAVDNTRSLTILAFRGSKSVRNFVADADFPATATDICPSCTAHQGFWNSWVEARTGVLAALKTAAASHPNNRVIVTGHSLGGAIADLAAAEIRKSGVTADLYTYGAPRIAGAALSDFITNQNAGGNYRVTHKNDPVPSCRRWCLDLSISLLNTTSRPRTTSYRRRTTSRSTLGRSIYWVIRGIIL